MLMLNVNKRDVCYLNITSC